MKNPELGSNPSFFTNIRQRIPLFARPEVEKTENFILLPEAVQKDLKRFKELCYLCFQGEFHPYHRRTWNEARTLEWSREEKPQELYFLVNQEPITGNQIKEIYRWEYRPDGLIALKSLTVHTPHFQMSIGEVILERQPEELSLKITAEKPGDKYRQDFFLPKQQKKALHSLLKGLGFPKEHLKLLLSV